MALRQGAGKWKQQKIPHIANPGTAQVGMGEAVNGAVAIVVAAGCIPAIEPCVGTQLYHPVGKRRPGHSMSMKTGSNKGIYILEDVRISKGRIGL